MFGLWPEISWAVATWLPTVPLVEQIWAMPERTQPHSHKSLRHPEVIAGWRVAIDPVPPTDFVGPWTFLDILWQIVFSAQEEETCTWEVFEEPTAKIKKISPLSDLSFWFFLEAAANARLQQRSRSSAEIWTACGRPSNRFWTFWDITRAVSGLQTSDIFRLCSGTCGRRWRSPSFGTFGTRNRGGHQWEHKVKGWDPSQITKVMCVLPWESLKAFRIMLDPIKNWGATVL